MSIARIAQGKFKFQDLVCIELALHFRLCADRSGSLLIEPSGGEDAEFDFPHPESPRRIEIQVKEDRAAVSLQTIARYLLHFPEGNKAECLLERVLKASNRIILFVLHGRCDDESSRYVIPLNWTGETLPRTVPLAAAKQLLQTLSDVVHSGKGTPLQRKRSAYLRTFLGNLTAKQVQASANRILIKERVDVASVRDSCGLYLRQRLVPTDEVPNAIQRLCEAVEDAKQKQCDVIPALKSVIRKASPPSVAPMLYVPRGVEGIWQQRLSDSGLLLLSGRPRCGKSEAGRYIAGEFQMQGFRINEGSDIEEAARYLLERTEDHRLFLLHDPLGGLTPTQNPHRTVETLRFSLAALSPSRKLIVCQNQDRIFEFFGTSLIQKCGVNGHAWFDLSCAAPSFLAEVWDALAERTQVSSPTRKQVRNALKLGKLDIEVGCVRHLAFSAGDLTRQSTVAEIEKKAREDACTLGLSIAAESSAMQETLTALAIASTPYQTIQHVELCFLLDREAREIPGVKRWHLAAIGDTREPEFPKYKYKRPLHPDYQRCLGRLQQRGFLRSGDAYSLEHPFYQAAASAVVERLDNSSYDLVLKILRRAVFCLSPETSLLAVGHLPFFMGVLHSEKHRQKLATIAVRALSSIFPATRDACLEFLVQNFHRLPSDRVRSMFQLVRAVANTSLADLAWHRGQAWIPSSQPFVFERLFPPPIERVVVAEELSMLDSNGTDTPSAERACIALEFLEWAPKSMSNRMARRFLSYHEGLIRAKAAAVWLSTNRNSDDDILDRIFVDSHPAVLLSVTQTVVSHWNDLALGRHRKILQRLQSLQFDAISALPLMDWLGRFDRVEETGHNPPWIVFGRLLPKVMRSLPAYADISDAHLFQSVKLGVNQLTDDSIQDICGEWISYLERCAETRLLTDYELGVTSILIVSVPAGTRRLRLVGRLVAIRGTAAKMLVLRDLVDGWPSLNSTEQKLVVALLSKCAVDQCWLKAAVATARFVPPAVQRLVYGEVDPQGLPAAELLRHLDPLLLKCLASIYARSGVICFIGLSCDSECLNMLFESLEHMPNHPLFDLVFCKAIGTMCDRRVQAAISACSARDLVRVFTIMLRKKVQWTGNWLPNSWCKLLTLVDEQTKSDWFDRIAEVAPGICDDISDVRLWLVNPPDQDELCLRLPSDLVLLSASARVRLVNKARRNDTSLAKFRSFLRATLKDSPPKLYGTYDRLTRVFSDLRIEDKSLERRLQIGRKRAIECSTEIRRSFQDQSVILQNWDGLQ